MDGRGIITANSVSGTVVTFVGTPVALIPALVILMGTLVILIGTLVTSDDDAVAPETSAGDICPSDCVSGDHVVTVPLLGEIEKATLVR